MAEKENIEYKASWRDEYLRLVCAFSNQDGGKLLIGVDDHGNVIGLDNPKKLLEDIPNKIQNYFGLVPRVNYHEEQNFIEVIIPPSQTPITYQGKFYVRSGSTLKTLEGKELQRFFFQKGDTNWDAIQEPDFTLDDIDDTTIRYFINLVHRRFPSEGNKLETADKQELLEKLHLVQNGKLTRAAILLFGKDPRQFFPNAFLKVGKFTSETDVQTQDEIIGNLFQQLDGLLEILKTKYLETKTFYKGVHRVEQLIYPESALREALVNALIHKDYSGPHIQVKVFNDSMSIWNYGKLPSELSLAQLKTSHPSFPRNELLANIFFKAGFIEAWGRGTYKIVQEMTKAGLPEPEFTEHAGGIDLSLFQSESASIYREPELNERQAEALQYLKRKQTSIDRKNYALLFEVSDRTALKDLKDLVEKGILVKQGKTRDVKYKMG